MKWLIVIAAISELLLTSRIDDSSGRAEGKVADVSIRRLRSPSRTLKAKIQPHLTLSVAPQNLKVGDDMAVTVTSDVALDGQTIHVGYGAPNPSGPPNIVGAIYMTQKSPTTWTATFPFDTTPATYTVRADFYGNDSYLPATSNSMEVTVTP